MGTRVFAFTRWQPFLATAFAIYWFSLLNAPVAMLVFPSLKKNDPLLWHDFNLSKRDMLEFLYMLVFLACRYGLCLSLDRFTRAVGCKQNWWMAMLIKWAGLQYSSGSLKCLFSENIELWAGPLFCLWAGLIILRLINASMYIGAVLSRLSKTPRNKGECWFNASIGKLIWCLPR